MPPEKAVFGARDLSSAATRDDDTHGQEYSGRDRRVTNRRSGQDRRAGVRFEVEAENRRTNHGRRFEDPAPKPW